MNMPTEQQRNDAIASHIRSVGAVNLSVGEVALTLDARCPGMTDEEFSRLKSDLLPAVAAARQAGIAAIWGE